MQDEQKTKSQLITELKALQQEAACLKSSLYECKQAEESLQKNHKSPEMAALETMKKKKVNSFDGKFTELRHRAEGAVRGRPADLGELSPDDTRKLLHELSVHQIELEIQNEELRRTQLELEKHRDKYAELYDFAPISYFTVGKNGLISKANLTGAAMLGMDRGRLLKQRFSSFVAVDDESVFFQHREQVFKTKSPQTCELKMVKKDGTKFDSLLRSIAKHDSQGNYNRFRTAVIDITEQRRAQEALQKAHKELEMRVEERTAELVQANEALCVEIAERKRVEITLRESEIRFKGLFNGMSAGVVFCKAVYDENGNMTDSIFKYMNPVYEKLTNLKKETAIGRKVSEKLRGIGSEWFSTFGEVLKTGNPVSFEMYHKNSKKYYSIFAYHSDKDEFSAIFEDITIRKKAEFALEESQNRFKALSEATFEAIFISKKGICIEANEAARKMFGYSYNELIDIFGTDVIAAESKELVKKNMLAGYEKPYDAIAQRKDGSKFNVEILGRMFEYKGTNVRITALRDITERKKTGQALKESEENFRNLFNENPLPLVEEDWSEVKKLLDEIKNQGITVSKKYFDENPDFFAKCMSAIKIVNINKATFRLFKYKNNNEFVQNICTIFTKKSFENIKNELVAIANDIKTFTDTTELSDADGNIISVIVQFRVVEKYNNLIFSITDITEQKQAEKKIKKYAETQEVLVREVNHRVKNNLFAIIGMMHKEQKRALAQGLPSLPVIKAMEGRIRGLATVHGLLSKGGWQPLQLSALCKQIISATLHNLTLSRKADLNVAASNVFVNSSQAHYLAIVINELATNTIKYALANRETIVINVDIKQTGNKVRISFCDNGPGYPQEMTDGDFKNSGIGFELIHGIVRHSLRGVVRIENDNGARTVISLQSAVGSRQ